MSIRTHPVPKPKKNDPPRHDTAVKIDAEVVRLARSVAAFREQSLAAYLSDLVRPLVARDFHAMTHEEPPVAKPRRKPDSP